MQSQIGGTQKKKIAYAKRLPIMTPVHLAHKGSCMLFIKKLLLAI